jgi:hypothetical protein
MWKLIRESVKYISYVVKMSNCLKRVLTSSFYMTFYVHRINKICIKWKDYVPSAVRTNHLTSGGKAPGTRWIQDGVAFNTDLNDLKRWTFLPLLRPIFFSSFNKNYFQLSVSNAFSLNRLRRDCLSRQHAKGQEMNPTDLIWHLNLDEQA